MTSFLYWSPRILSILFVTFISIFALDVFEGYSGWQLVVGLFMHLLPSILLLLIVLLAWRYGLIGAMGFIGFALWYIWAVGPEHVTWWLIIAGPAAITGVLYFADWFVDRKGRSQKKLS